MPSRTQTVDNLYPNYVPNPYPYIEGCASQHEPSWPSQSHYSHAATGYNLPPDRTGTPLHWQSPHHQATTSTHPCQLHYPQASTTCQCQQHTQEPTYWTCPSPAQQPGRHHGHGYGQRQCFPTGKLILTIVRARNIKGDEWHHHGKADPYGLIELGGKDYGDQRRTVTREDEGSFPVWNQMFSFFIKKEDREYNELTISLVNRNTFPRRDNLLGQLRIINLGPYITGRGNNVREQWYPVIYKGIQQGEILLVFNFIPMSAEELLNSTEIRMGTESTVDYGNPNAKASWSPATSIQVATGVLQVVLSVAAIVLPLL